jgi:hypothetical protein
MFGTDLDSASEGLMLTLAGKRLDGFQWPRLEQRLCLLETLPGPLRHSHLLVNPLSRGDSLNRRIVIQPSRRGREPNTENYTSANRELGSLQFRGEVLQGIRCAMRLFYPGLEWWNCREQILRGGVVAECFTHMREVIHVARAEDEAAAQLKRVLAEFVLAMPGRARPLPASRVVAAQQVQQIGGTELGRAISFAIFVNQQGKCDPGFFSK